MRSTRRFNVVELQTYSDAQIEFIASVEDQYDEDLGLSNLTADYADKLAKL